MPQPRSILVVIHYPVDVGYAVGRLVSVFYRMAVRLVGDAANVHFSFTSLGDGSCDALPAQFTNYTQFQPRGYDAESVERLVQYIRLHKIDLLFGFDLGIEAPYLKELRSAGIWTIVSYFGAPLGSLLPTPLLALKRMEVKFLRPSKPDLIIVESKAMARTALGGRGIPREMIRVVRNGVDLDRFRRIVALHEMVFDQFQIPKGRSVILYMGHFHERKGVHVLLRAAIHICKVLDRRNIHFLFLGTTARDIDRVERIVDVSAIRSNLTYGGYQSQIPELLSGCTLGCVPTTGWDSFPLSPLEMQAASLPVVVSDCQGLPETVEANVTGLVVPAGQPVALAEALLTLIDDVPRRTRMGIAARLRIENELSDEAQVDGLVAAVRDASALTARN